MSCMCIFCLTLGSPSLRADLGMNTKQGAEKRWSRLKKNNFGVKKSGANSSQHPAWYPDLLLWLHPNNMGTALVRPFDS